MTRPSTEAVMDALSAVLDPCSCQTESPVDVVELGLIEDVNIEHRTVTITLLPTSPMCMYVPHMTEEIQRRVGCLPGVKAVHVTQDTERLWTPDRMSQRLRRDRNERRAERIEAEDLVPYAESG